jgi:hypothetical protein
MSYVQSKIIHLKNKFIPIQRTPFPNLVSFNSISYDPE